MESITILTNQPLPFRSFTRNIVENEDEMADLKGEDPLPFTYANFIPIASTIHQQPPSQTHDIHNIYTIYHNNQHLHCSFA